MSAYKAIIFDMDGTLFDSEQLCLTAWDEANIQFHVDISKAMQTSFIGHAKKAIIASLADYLHDQSLAERVFAYHMKYQAQYIEANGMPQKADLLQLLQSLKEDGYKLGIATSTERALTIKHLQRANILTYFDVLTCGDEVTHSKPSPDIYHLALQRLGMDGAQCLVIEDSISGVASAYHAGIDVIMIPDVLPPDEETKKRVLSILPSLDDVVPYLSLE